MNKTSKRSKVIFLGTILGSVLGCILSCIFDNISILPSCLGICTVLEIVYTGILYPKKTN